MSLTEDLWDELDLSDDFQEEEEEEEEEEEINDDNQEMTIDDYDMELYAKEMLDGDGEDDDFAY